MKTFDQVWCELEKPSMATNELDMHYIIGYHNGFKKAVELLEQKYNMNMKPSNDDKKGYAE